MTNFCFFSLTSVIVFCNSKNACLGLRADGCTTAPTGNDQIMVVEDVNWNQKWVESSPKRDKENKCKCFGQLFILKPLKSNYTDVTIQQTPPTFSVWWMCTSTFASHQLFCFGEKKLPTHFTLFFVFVLSVCVAYRSHINGLCWSLLGPRAKFKIHRSSLQTTSFNSKPGH